MTIKIGVLVSGSGTNLQAIMDACENNKIDGKVVCVGSDNPEAFGLRRAENNGIKTFILNYKEARKDILDRGMKAPEDLNVTECISKCGGEIPIYPKAYLKLATRAVVEKLLLKLLTLHGVDLLVCAGFMKILTPYFLDKFQPEPTNPHVMNIHPALLPSFPGINGYGDAWNYGVKVYGPTVHFMNYVMDDGPIIGQTALIKREGDNFEIFKNRGLEAEYDLYTNCIQLFAQGRLKVKLGPDGKQPVVEILPPRRFSSR